MINDEEKYKEAKKIFFGMGGYCIIKKMLPSVKKEFDKYNVPQKVILSWANERKEELLKDIYSDYFDIYRLAIMMNLLFELYGTYELDFNELLSVIIYLDNKNKLGKMFRTSKKGKHYFLFATHFIYDSSMNSLVSSENYFKRDENFYGLLPTLYDLEDKKSYNTLLSILIKIVKNDALYCQEMVKSLLSFTSIYDSYNYNLVLEALDICKSSNILEEQIPKNVNLKNVYIPLYKWWI